jgi:hypothetical protein
VTVTEFVSEVQSYTDNSSPSDTDISDNRTRILQDLRAVTADVTFRRPWPFRQKKSALLTLSSGAVSVPSDFVDLGPYRGVYNASTGLPLRETDEQEIQDIRQANGSDPCTFAIFGQDSTTGDKQIQVPTTAALTLYVWYQRGVPTLDEDDNVDNLNIAIPSQYHQLVLLPGVRARRQRSKGDARSREDAQAFEDGIKIMARSEKRQRSYTRRSPGFWAR